MTQHFVILCTRNYMETHVQLRLIMDELLNIMKTLLKKFSTGSSSPLSFTIFLWSL